MVLKHNESLRITLTNGNGKLYDKLINQSTTSTSFIHPMPLLHMYVTDDRQRVNSWKPVKSRVKECYDIEIIDENHTGFPLFFQSNIATIFIPKRSNSFRRFVPNSIWKYWRDKKYCHWKMSIFVSWTFHILCWW
jgi:hypothetical protein